MIAADLPVLDRGLAEARRGVGPSRWWAGKATAWLRNYHGHAGPVDPAELAREWARGATWSEAAMGVLSRIPIDLRREHPTPED